MKWETVRLGDIANFSNGINFDKSAYAKGVMLIGVSDFGDKFYPDYSKLSQVKKDIVRENDYLKDGDIVFVRSNGNKELVGRCMLIRNPPTAITYSGFCIRARLKDTSTYNPVFFTYHFKGIDFRRAMSGTAVGANIQNLSQTRLSNYGVLIPDIKTQQHIANILSAYDQLIESNQKQIKLLEEAAQRLYKEWFVDFRFPGYENVPIVDGVPEGWAKAPLRRIINYEIGGGWGEEAPTEKCEKPAYVIRGTDMYGMIHGDMYGIPYRYHEMNNLNARELIDGDIIFEVSGGSKTEGVARTLLIRQSLLEAFHSPVICASFLKVKNTSNTYMILLSICATVGRQPNSTNEVQAVS